MSFKNCLDGVSTKTPFAQTPYLASSSESFSKQKL
jgi:hypothetical protein